jgi:hypothetical protein
MKAGGRRQYEKQSRPSPFQKSRHHQKLLEKYTYFMKFLEKINTILEICQSDWREGVFPGNLKCFTFNARIAEIGRCRILPTTH